MNNNISYDCNSSLFENYQDILNEDYSSNYKSLKRSINGSFSEDAAADYTFSNLRMKEISSLPETLNEKPNKKKTSVDSVPSVEYGVKNINEEELMIYTFTAPINDVKNARDKIQSYFQNHGIDFHSPNPNTFMGYYFESRSYVCFKLEIITVNLNELYIRCLRYDGDALVLKTFFDSLLGECGWKLSNDDEIDDGDDPFADSDDEEEEEEDFSDFKYLNFSYDEQLLDQWVDVLKRPSTSESDRVNILLLLCFNSENESNFKLMSDRCIAIIDSLFCIMKMDDASFREIYGCCHLLTCLKNSQNFDLKNDYLQIIVDCLVKWSNVGEQCFNWETPVPVSNNIQQFCASLLKELTPKIANGVNMKKLYKVIQHEKTSTDVSSVLTTVMKQTVCVC